MTLISTIIRDAYRESNLIAISADPTTNEQAEGLRLLNRFILSLFGNEAGEPLTSIPIGSGNIDRPSSFPGYTDQPCNDWFAPVNSRLILNLTSAQTVFMHPAPHDGARFAIVDKSGNLATYNLILDGNGYTVEAALSKTLNTNSMTREYFFRGDTGDWGVVAPLIASDASPFPEKFDDLLIVGLAIRLNPRNDVAADQQSIETLQSNMRKFKAQYNQTIEMPVEDALLRTSGMGRAISRLGYNDMDAFTYGHPGWPYG